MSGRAGPLGTGGIGRMADSTKTAKGDTMNDPLEVDLGDLRTALDILIDHVVEVQGSTTVRLPHDYFWSVPSDELFNVLESPQNLTIGQLSESLVNLQLMRQDEERVISYGFVWAADVLRAVALTVRP